MQVAHLFLKNPLHTGTFLLLTSLFSMTQAQANAAENTMGVWHPVVGVSAGVVIAPTVGESQSVTVPSSFSTYTYSRKSSTQTAALAGVFLGGEVELRKNWALQIGVDYNQSNSFKASGNVVQGISPILDSGTYQYSVVTRQLLMLSKFLYTYKDRYHPYALVGLGGSFNTASGYSASVSGTSPTPQFADNTSVSFSYAVGAGVDMDVMPRLRVGLGYRFANLGAASLGATTVSNVLYSSNTLSQSHLYAHEVVAQLTYIFA
jgi:opacity protein-like surface antigen